MTKFTKFCILFRSGPSVSHLSCAVFFKFNFRASPLIYLYPSALSRFDNWLQLKLRQLQLIAGHAVDGAVDGVVDVAVGLIERVPQQSQGHCFKQGEDDKVHQVLYLISVRSFRFTFVLCSVLQIQLQGESFDIYLYPSALSRFDNLLQLKLRQLQLVAGDAVDGAVDSVVDVAIRLVECVSQRS